MYTAANGETTIMIPVDVALVRGKSYKVVFDQDGIEADTIGTTARTDVTVSDSDEMEYLTAPASIEVVTSANGQKATVNLLDENGEVLSYLGNGDNLAGFDSFIIKGAASAVVADAKQDVAGGTIKECVHFDSSFSKELFILHGRS